MNVKLFKSIEIIVIVLTLSIGLGDAATWIVGSGDDSWSTNATHDNTTVYNNCVRILNGYVGNKYSAETYSTPYLDSAEKKVAMRFTSQANVQISNISIDISSISGASPTYKVGIQENDGTGYPSGTYLSNGTFTPLLAGWHTISMASPISIFRGEVYHIIVEYDSGTIDSGNCFRLSMIRKSYKHNLWQPYHHGGDTNFVFDDSQLYTQFYDGTSWDTEPYWETPTFVLHTSTEEIYGQAYNDGTVIYVGWYGLNGEWMNQTIKISTASKHIDKVCVYLYSVIGSPTMVIEIRDSEENVLATNSTIPVSGWNEVTLNQTVFLQKDNTYSVIVYCSGTCNSSNWIKPFTLDTVSSYQAISFGGAESYFSKSADGGSTWTSYFYKDMQFALHIVENYEGNFISISKDAESISSSEGVWKQISFNGNIPTNTNVDIYVRSSFDNGTSDPWTDWTLVQANAVSEVVYDLPLENRERYGQWKLELNTTDASLTPEIQSVRFISESIAVRKEGEKVSLAPNPFTPTHPPYDKVYFNIENAQGESVKLEIYSIKGRLISRKNFAPSESIYWDGKNTHGKIAEDGGYIYQLKVGSKTYNGTLVLAK